MKYFKITSDSIHWAGCSNEVYVKAKSQDDLDWEVADNEDYVRVELIDPIDEEDDGWFEEYDLVTSTIEEVDEAEYLRNKD